MRGRYWGKWCRDISFTEQVLKCVGSAPRIFPSPSRDVSALLLASAYLQRNASDDSPLFEAHNVRARLLEMTWRTVDSSALLSGNNPGFSMITRRPQTAEQEATSGLKRTTGLLSLCRNTRPTHPVSRMSMVSLFELEPQTIASWQTLEKLYEVRERAVRILAASTCQAQG